MTLSTALLRVLLPAALFAALTGCALAPGQAARITEAHDARAFVAETEQGSVEGVSAPEGTAFLAIPFAAPPVGDLRFAPPQPARPWRGVRQARRLAPGCPQAFPGTERAEDCLYLDIYGPSDLGPGQTLPVMVWLYGGGFVFGSNAQYDGSRLAETQRMIVVVPNYRVGALGFFAHPALRGPGEGNYGLLDQRAALTWVRRNIANFGGDPDRVTLFGESAGATSACAHMVSPGSRNLFDRVILQSGSCLFPEQSISREAAETGGVASAHELGCATGDRESILRCLRSLPASSLVTADSHRWGNTGENSWSPMVGGDVLPRHPRSVFEDGDGAPVALVVGSNRDEGRLISNLLTALFRWTSRAGYERSVEQAVLPQFRARVLAEYEDLARRSYYLAFAAILTDSRFACPMLTLARLRGPTAETYAYEFDDPNAPTLIPRVPFTPRQKSFHAAELIYVFQRPLFLADPREWTPAQRALSERIQAYWGAFAATGRPAVKGMAPWPLFDGARPFRLTPESDRTMVASDFAERHRCRFWTALGY